MRGSLRAMKNRRSRKSKPVPPFMGRELFVVHLDGDVVEAMIKLPETGEEPILEILYQDGKAIYEPELRRKVRNVMIGPKSLVVGEDGIAQIYPCKET